MWNIKHSGWKLCASLEIFVSCQIYVFHFRVNVFFWKKIYFFVFFADVFVPQFVQQDCAFFSTEVEFITCFDFRRKYAHILERYTYREIVVTRYFFRWKSARDLVKLCVNIRWWIKKSIESVCVEWKSLNM